MRGFTLDSGVALRLRKQVIHDCERLLVLRKFAINKELANRLSRIAEHDLFLLAHLNLLDCAAWLMNGIILLFASSVKRFLHDSFYLSSH